MGRVAELLSLGGITHHTPFMPYFEVEFIDGKAIELEAAAYPEQRDDEWLFLLHGRIVAQYQRHEVRGIRQLPPPEPSYGGGSYG